MRKPDFCICENKDAGQLRGNREADQRLCFRYSTEAYKGHCVLCKDVLSFVYQTFDFQVLCFGFCVLCPVLLNGAMET